MRWFGRYLVLVLIWAGTLFAARYASHRLVYDYIHALELDDFYGTPPETTFAQVSGHFAESIADLTITKPFSPFFPFAKIVGLIDVPTIVLASLVLALARFRALRLQSPSSTHAQPLPKD